MPVFYLTQALYVFTSLWQYLTGKNLKVAVNFKLGRFTS
jgi:hypothetical protein